MIALRVTLAGLLVVAGCQPAEQPTEALQPQDEVIVDATAEEHAGDAAPTSPMAQAAPARSLLEQELAYGEAEGRNLTGFLAIPEDAIEPLPGLLVIHEWWGLNDNIRSMVRRLAAEGYIALAVDLYGGGVAQEPAEAQVLMAEMMGNPEGVRDNLRQAYEYLDLYAFAPRIGSIGWGFGGAWSLQTGLMLPDQLDAMVMYYGRVVTDEAELEPLQMPILGFFGEQDQSIPIHQVQAFRSALGRLGKEAQVRIYTGAAHAFADPSGGSYAPVAAEDAWNETVRFLDTHLRAPSL